MQDLTQGSVTRHLLALSSFMAVSMMFQTVYYLADLYFVGRLGKEAIAAVGLSGNLMVVVLAITQTLGVGTTTLISHAVGQKDRERAILVFNQAFALSQFVGLAVAGLGFGLRGQYCRWLGADGVTARLGVQYLNWFLPAMLLQFVIVAMGSALRGSGVVKPTVGIQILTVVLNIMLAPVLILGWGTGHPLGVAGAALATFLAILVGTVVFWAYFLRPENYLRFSFALWRPRGSVWWGMTRVGLPAGGEFALMSVYMVIVYWIIRNFGAAAQAGFGIGARVMQSMFLPVMAISFAAAPLAGQNFGARNAERVRQTFRSASLLVSAIMILFTLLSHIAPEALIRTFSREPEVIAFGAEYLRIISYNFLAMGLIFTTSSVFQGMGHTLPPLACSSLRLLLFALPVLVLSQRLGFQIREVWNLSVGSVAIQAVLLLLLVQREFRRRLVFAPAAVVGAVPGEQSA
ncbi:MAG: MATE family efflux transporter [Acidobacteria bacterium 13_1_40CM_4_69_4]|nr:MAG: MATE family efflux transporter [Acidobacteria bacterium 13_1_40CM_4_69_4]